MSAIPDELPSDDDEVDQLDEEIENEIKEALSCPCVSDLKEGPCGGEFVNSFSCFMRNNREGKELENCVKAFNLLQECMIQHPEQFADFVEAKPSEDKEKHSTTNKN